MTPPARPGALDEASRPTVARGLRLTPAQQAPGNQLRMIHDAFRTELEALEQRVDDVRRGDASAADVRAAIAALGLGTGGLTLAQHCAQLCRLVEMHHGVEDQAMFPLLAAHAAVRPVVERLAEEHVVIHAHLVHVDELATHLDTEPGVVVELAAAVSTFAAVLRSHFAYEEDELSEPLGVLGLGI